MIIKKRGNAGVTLLICLLFVLVIAMAAWIVLDKINIIQNGTNNGANNVNGNASNEYIQNNNESNETNNSATSNENKPKEIIAEKFRSSRLNIKGITACTVKSIDELDTLGNLTLYSISYSIGYNDDYIGTERLAGQWTADGNLEVLVEKKDGDYEIKQTANGGLAYTLKKDYIAEKFRNSRLNIKGITACTVKSIDELDALGNLTLYSISYSIEYNDDYIGTERLAGQWTADGSLEVLVEKKDGDYEIKQTANGGLRTYFQ